MTSSDKLEDFKMFLETNMKQYEVGDSCLTVENRNLS